MKRTPVRGVKEYLKPSIYKQWKRYASPSGGERATACLLHNEPASYSQGQGEAICIAVAKASLNRAHIVAGSKREAG